MLSLRALSPTSLAERGRELEPFAVTQHNQLHHITRLVCTERFGHTVQVGELVLADLNQDIASLHAGLFRRAARPDSVQAYTAG